MEIYVDGAGSNQKTLCGGWAYVVYDNNKYITSKSGGAKDTTNNRMELQAVVEAMSDYAQSFSEITIYCDSAYIVNCIQQKWYLNWEANGWITSKKTPVLNKDLWIKLLSLYRTGTFKIVKVAGHTGVHGNIMADKLAVQEKKKQEGLLICQELSSLHL